VLKFEVSPLHKYNKAKWLCTGIDSAEPGVVPGLADGDAARGVHNEKLANEVRAVVADGVRDSICACSAVVRGLC
jgi:hypothetical protein